MSKSPWQILGIKKTNDQRAIKKAYAAKLKVTRPEDDPIAFQMLVEARDMALIKTHQQMIDKFNYGLEFQSKTLSNYEDTKVETNPSEPPHHFSLLEQFEEILTGEIADIPFERLERIVEELRSLSIAARLEIEPHLLFALELYFENQEKNASPKIDTLHSSYQKYLVILLDEEFQWSNNERRIYEIVPFLSPEFADQLQRLKNPKYRPEVIKPKRSWTISGQLIWYALVLIALAAKNCSRETPIYETDRKDAFNRKKQEIIWRRNHPGLDPATNWIYHVPPVGPPN
jgi:hypothetical protein